MDTAAHQIWSELESRWRQLRRSVAFWGPTVELPSWTAPAVAIGALIALALVSGIALVSLGVLLTALLTAHLLLDRIFGVSVGMAPPR
jgi:hypothetical protein